MKDNGQMACRTEMEYSMIKMVLNLDKGNGKMAVTSLEMPDFIIVHHQKLFIIHTKL
jgi:hypothetical protein